MKLPTEIITPPAVFRRVLIPKRSGGHRSVYVVEHRRVKTFLRFAHELLLTQGVTPTMYRHGLAHVVYGFVRDQSPITCAARHFGFSRTVAMDIEDFFPSCTYEKFRSIYQVSQAFNFLFFHIHSLVFQLRLPEVLQVKDWTLAHTLGLLFPDGAAQQGLPTSPDLANLIAFRLDSAIIRVLSKHRLAPSTHVYTRYADDITVSHDGDAYTSEMVIAVVASIIAKYGFRLNKRKTQRYWIGAGSRVVVGISLSNHTDDPQPMRPCRATRRRFHATQQALANLDPDRLGSTDRALAERYRLTDRVEGMAMWFEQFKSPKCHELCRKPYRILQKPPELANRVVEVQGKDTTDPIDVKPPPITERRLDQ